QEIGYAEDCDEQLRDAISQQRDVELVGEDYDDVVDAVLLWWRDGDGDLFEALVDALTPLADGGYIWLLTPKPGRDNYVEPSEIGEAAPTAGLSQTSSLSAGRDWLGTRLGAPPARRWPDRPCPGTEHRSRAPGGCPASMRMGPSTGGGRRGVRC